MSLSVFMRILQKVLLNSHKKRKKNFLARRKLQKKKRITLKAVRIHKIVSCLPFLCLKKERKSQKPGTKAFLKHHTQTKHFARTFSSSTKLINCYLTQKKMNFTSIITTEDAIKNPQQQFMKNIPIKILFCRFKMKKYLHDNIFFLPLIKTWKLHLTSKQVLSSHTRTPSSLDILPLTKFPCFSW